MRRGGPHRDRARQSRFRDRHGGVASHADGVHAAARPRQAAARRMGAGDGRAAGGLGSAGIQVAKYLGAKVIAAAGAAERVKVGLDLGADAGVNYRAQDLTMEAMRITEGKGVNVVFENIGDPDLFPKAFAALARRGDWSRPADTAAALCRSTSTGSIRITSRSSARPARRRKMSRSASRPQRKGASRWWSTASCRCRRPCRRTRVIESRSGIGKIILDPTNSPLQRQSGIGIRNVAGCHISFRDSFFCVMGFIPSAALTLL